MPTETNLREGERWRFDEEVAGEFDAMLERSIPDYERMRELTTDVACEFIPRGIPHKGVVVDVGCSRGEAIARLRDRVGVNARYYGTDVSDPMIEAARDRFAGNADVAIHKHDLRNGIPRFVPPADVVLAVLTIQFTPIEYRLGILDGLYRRIKPGGALLLVEKVVGATAALDQLFVELYHEMKGDHGYSKDEIARKRAALEGVLVPLPASMTEDMLRRAGFGAIDVYWRALNFSAWVAFRPGD